MRVITLAVSMAIFIGVATYTMAQGTSPAGGRVLNLTGRDAAIADDNDTLDRELGCDFTIEAWIYIPALPKDDAQWTIVAKPDSYEWSIVGPKHKFAMEKAYSFVFSISPGQEHMGIAYLMGDGIIKGDITSEWHHCAIMADSAGFRWAFDGEELSGGPFCAIPDSDSKFFVGGRPDRPKSFFDGAIDELRISRIKRYEKSPFELPAGEFNPDADAVALWHFDETVNIFQDHADGNILFLRKGGLSVDPSGKFTTNWGLIKHDHR